MRGECHVTFGGLPCCHPPTTAEACAVLRLPAFPTAPWGGAANEFYNPLGPGPGRGTLLMLFSELDRLDRTAAQALEFSDGTKRIRLKNITLAYAASALPGGRNDRATPFWLEVVDRRHIAAGGAVLNAAYNVLDADGTAYLSATKNGGSAWTWTTLTQAVWNANGLLGDWPGLPFTPDGTPENFIAWGRPSFDLLNEILDRIGCALKLDLEADTFDIVRIADTDTAAARALRGNDPLRQWDSYPVDVARGRIAETVRVFFAKLLPASDSTGGSPYYTLDRTDTSTGGGVGVATGTVVAIFDDMAAVYNSSSALQNGTALGTRATERASDWFRRARAARLHRVYSGLHGDLQPGSRLKGVRYISHGMGAFTEVAAHPGYGPPGVLLDGALGGGESPGFPSPPGPSGPGSVVTVGGGGGGDLIPGGSGGGGGGTSWLPGRAGPGGGRGGPGRPGAGGGFGFGMVGGGPGGLALLIAQLWPLLRPLVDQEARFTIESMGGIGLYESYFRLTATGWMPGGHYTGNTQSVTPTIDTIYYYPLLFPKGASLDRLAIEVLSAIPSAKCRVGLWNNSSVTALQPTSLIVDSGELDCASTGVKTATISQTLTAGTLYWLGLVVSHSGLSLRGGSHSSGSFWPLLGFGDGSSMATSGGVGWSESFTYAALTTAGSLSRLEPGAGGAPLPFTRLA